MDARARSYRNAPFGRTGKFQENIRAPIEEVVMRLEMEDFKTGWIKINIGLKKVEIDRLIDLLRMLKKGDEHFHFASDYEGDKGVGDIEFYVKADEQPDNMEIAGLNIRPNR
ncbi:MAG: hypothetical protein IPQ26_10665 [Elusimicrobia bacterium]|nr:hypothetical protein [Elusimicrobiota bacterium]